MHLKEKRPPRPPLVRVLSRKWTKFWVPHLGRITLWEAWMTSMITAILGYESRGWLNYLFVVLALFERVFNFFPFFSFFPYFSIISISQFYHFQSFFHFCPIFHFVIFQFYSFFNYSVLSNFQLFSILLLFFLRV